MAPHLLTRSGSVDAATTPPVSNTVYIVGFTLAGFFAVVAASWIALRFFRHKFQGKRAEARGAAFLNVRGVIQEMDEPVNHILSAQTTNSVIFPHRAVVPRTPKIVVPSRHDDVPSSQVHAAGSSPSPRPCALSGLNPAHPRHSRASSAQSPSTYRFPPGLHSRESSRSSSSFQARSVRQLFQPVLADELALSRVGEHLLVLQSFDDGWCLAARDNSRNSRSSFSIFNPSRLSSRVESSGDNAGVGFVPAWVFIKPVKGMRVERPIRISSAGGLYPGSGAPESRNSTISGISWSNFG